MALKFKFVWCILYNHIIQPDVDCLLRIIPVSKYCRIITGLLQPWTINRKFILAIKVIRIRLVELL